MSTSQPGNGIDWRRDRRRGLQLECAGSALLIGGPLLVFGLIWLIATVFPQLEDLTLLALLILVISPIGFFLSMYGAFKLAYLGKQYQARGHAKALETDPRTPVVYLRPFIADESLRAVFKAAIGQGLWLRFGSFEEQLSQALQPVGPLVAIGAPGEALPTPGAVRRYASDAEWQSVVQSWLGRARLIVVRPGLSEGLWWELRQAMSLERPGKLILLLYRMRRAEYERFARRVQQDFGTSLPSFDRISRWGAVNGFIQFASEWEPSFLPLRAPLLRGNVALPQCALIHHALGPVFRQLGVPWQPAPLSIIRTVALFLIGTAIIAFLVIRIFS